MNSSDLRRIVGVLGVVLFLGGIFRLYGLSRQSLWHDELESWRQSNFDNWADVIRLGVEPDTHPPLYQSLLFTVEKYLGDSEVLLRAPSAILGITSILAMFGLGKRVYSHREGLLSAFFIAILWAPIFYSQEARNYSLVILFSILSFFFWIPLFYGERADKGFSIGNSLGYILVSLGLIYTHYFGFLILVLQGFIAVISNLKNRTNLLHFLILYVLIAIGYLPWLPSAIEQFSHTENISWIDVPKLTVFPAFISFLFNRSHLLAIVALAVISYVLISRIVDYRKTIPHKISSLLRSPDFVIGYWLVIPLALAVIVSLLWNPIYTQRNLLISLPAAYLLFARGIVLLPLNRVVKAVLVALFAGSSLYQMLYIQAYYKLPNKEQFREAVYQIVEYEQQFKDSVVLGQVRYSEYLEYYFDRRNTDLGVDILIDPETDTGEVIEVLATSNPEAVWYIAAHYPPDQHILDFLMQNYIMADNKMLIGAEVWLFTK